MSRLLKETFFLSLSVLLSQLGQLHTALGQFWEDSRARTTLNAWVYAEARGRGQCCLMLGRRLQTLWSNETLGQNTLLPPRSSPCAPLLFGSCACSGYFMTPVHSNTLSNSYWQENQLPCSDFRNYAKIGREMPVRVVLVIIRLFISILNIFSMYMSSWLHKS